MAKTTFAKGDTVELKSGGPRMTVSIASKKDIAEGDPEKETWGDDDLLCIWFNNGELKRMKLSAVLVREAG